MSTSTAPMSEMETVRTALAVTPVAHEARYHASFGETQRQNNGIVTYEPRYHVSWTRRWGNGIAALQLWLEERVDLDCCSWCLIKSLAGRVATWLSPGRLYRKARGGKWERWWHRDPGNCYLWDRVDDWYANTGNPPAGLACDLIAMEFNGETIEPGRCAAPDCNRLAMVYPVDNETPFSDKHGRTFVSTRCVGYEPPTACEQHTPGFS